MFKKMTAGLALAALTMSGAAATAASARTVRPSMLVFSPTAARATGVVTAAAPLVADMRASTPASKKSDFFHFGAFAPLFFASITIVITVVVVVVVNDGNSSSPG